MAGSGVQRKRRHSGTDAEAASAAAVESDPKQPRLDEEEEEEVGCTNTMMPDKMGPFEGYPCGRGRRRPTHCAPSIISSLFGTAKATSDNKEKEKEEEKKEVVVVSSWNVAGIAAAMKKGFERYVRAEDPDILCLQETKLNKDADTSSILPEFKYRYFACCLDKKGYSGTAILSHLKPESVTYGLRDLTSAEEPELDTEGRVITLEFAKLHLVALYTPNAGQDLKRLGFRELWDRNLALYVQRLQKTTGKEVLLCGDFNVSHMPIDLARPDTNAKTAGFTPQERQGFTKVLEDTGCVDVLRKLKPGRKGLYTYFSYRFQCRSKRIGWRLDYFLATPKLMCDVLRCDVRDAAYGASDHVPLVLLLDNTANNLFSSSSSSS